MAFELSPDELSNAFLQRERCSLLLERLGGVEGLALLLRTDLNNGLPENEARDNFRTRRAYYGDNFCGKPRKFLFSLLWKAFGDSLVFVLCLAALFSLFISLFVSEGSSHQIQSLALLFATLLMLCITAIQYWVERQYREFEDMIPIEETKEVRVIRDGREQEVRISEIFVGDIVVIDCGDQIPADGIITQADSLTVDESVMTGKYDSLPKSPNGDFRLLSGCQCDGGRGSMLVVATGARSRWGISLMKLSDDCQETPLQKKLDEMATMFGLVGFSFAMLMFCILIYWFVVLGEDDWVWKKIRDIVDIFILVMTIMVVSVPVGFPLFMTVSLASTRNNGLVRKMGACAMGSVTDICWENTGTLTENIKIIEAGWMAGEEFQVVPPNLQVENGVLHMIHESIALNSSPFTRVEIIEDLPKFIGNKTECALLMFSGHCGYDYEEIRRNSKVTQVYPFSSARRKMSCVIPSGVGHRLYCKGAPEIVLQDCVSVMRGDGEQIPITEEIKRQLLGYVNCLAARGLQTLCLTCRFIPHYNPDVEIAPLEQNLTVLAIVGIRDPIRKGVLDAVMKCQNAGAVVRMITHDDIDISILIAEEVGILTKGGLALEGHQFAKMSDAEIDEVLPRLQVLARSKPTDKFRIVRRLKANNHVVGVSGDGCGDASVLKGADIGFAMGIAGTAVSKEASDIILSDDNFSSCVFWISWGRCIFDNSRKFVQFWLTGTFSILLVVFIGVFSQRGSPLTAIQLLWANLILNTGGLALGTEKPHPRLLEHPPINLRRCFFSNIMIKNIVGQVIYQVLILCFIMLAGTYIWDVLDGSDIHKTYLFNSFVFAQVFNQINARMSNGELNDNFFANPIFVGTIAVTVVLQFLIVNFGGVAFRCVPLSFEEWLVTVLIGFGSIPLGMILRVIPVPEYDGWGFYEPDY